MATPEGKITAKLKKLWEGEDAFVFKVHGHVMQKSGMPDVYVCHPTWRGWIELKTENREVTLIQRLTVEKLRRAGDNACVARWKNGQFWLDEREGMQFLCEGANHLLSALSEHEKTGGEW
jgi:hypothetical protein